MSYEKCLHCVCSLVLKVNEVAVLFLHCSLKVTVLVFRPGDLVLPLLSQSCHCLWSAMINYREFAHWLDEAAVNLKCYSITN